jgi:exonuclease SbcC
VRPVRVVLRAFGPFAGETTVDYRELDRRTFFLICGPTGAGKTTLLDAKAFALFGRTSGGDRDARDMRSQQADPNFMTEVIFDFALGDETYRIRRVPRQSRPAIRGTRMVDQIPKATLWRRTGISDDAAEGVPIADGWDEVTEKVQELVGFTVDQFRQVILLPQGQFLRFLSATSSEREKILEVLFRTEAYRRIEDALKEAAGGLQAQAKELRDLEAGILSNESAANPEELVVRKIAGEERAAVLAGSVKELRSREELLARAITEAREIARRIAEREDSRRDLEVLERGRDADALRQRTVQLARKALPLVPLEAELALRNREAGGAELERREAQAALESARGAAGQADRSMALEQGRDGERLRASEELRSLEETRGRAAALDALRNKVSEARAESGRVEATLREAEATVEKTRGSIEKKRDLLTQAEALAPEAESIKGPLEDAARRVADHGRLAEARTKIVPLQESHREAGQSADSLERDIRARRTAVAELETAWVRGQAAVLAAGLEAGKPCGVCGSTVHPAPAQAAGDTPGERELKLARESVQMMEDCRKGVLQAVSTAFERLSLAQAALRGLEDSVRGVDAEESVRREVELRGRFERARSAAGLRPGLKREIESLAAQFQGEQSKRDGLSQAAQAVRTEADGAAALLVHGEAAVPAGMRDAGAVDRAIAAARGRAVELEAALEAARSDVKRRGEEAAGAQARTAAAEISARRSAQLAEDASGRFAAAMDRAGFGSGRDYEAARRTPEEIDRLDADSRKYEGDLRAARVRLRRAEEAAGGLAVRPVEPIEEEFRGVQAEEERAVREETASRREAERLGRTIARLVEQAERRAAIEREFAVMGRLSQVANGQNPERLTLQRFVLRSLLQEVLAVASRRLSEMSRGRYSLQVARPGGEVRSAGGLELEVLDAWTGLPRPVATLSGGEGFLASLALALGLADVVQSRAGGIRLETVFVDEGFGTLDEETLELAIDTLKGLRERGRRVGIISHVRELRERIDTRLEVSAGRDTSTARFVLA